MQHDDEYPRLETKIKISDLLEQPCKKSDNAIKLVTSCYSASTVSGATNAT
jgi:hypothetical protein